MFRFEIPMINLIDLLMIVANIKLSMRYIVTTMAIHNVLLKKKILGVDTTL